MMITVEYVDSNGKYEVCEGDDFHGVYETLTEAYDVAHEICPAGEPITGMNLNDFEYSLVALWNRTYGRLEGDDREGDWFVSTPEHAWELQRDFYDPTARGRGAVGY